jgi:putative membrane protein
MIKNFGDHSANERTFLACVRTAIAVMAFGFLVEKFDLFLEVAAPSLAGRTLSLPGQKFGNIGGLALIVLGTAMIAIAAIRFLTTAKTIDSSQPCTSRRSAVGDAGQASRSWRQVSPATRRCAQGHDDRAGRTGPWLRA